MRKRLFSLIVLFAAVVCLLILIIGVSFDHFTSSEARQLATGISQGIPLSKIEGQLSKPSRLLTTTHGTVIAGTWDISNESVLVEFDERGLASGVFFRAKGQKDFESIPNGFWPRLMWRVGVKTPSKKIDTQLHEDVFQ
jgi:hypothetical protein